MLTSIVENVRRRTNITTDTLSLTGPRLLQRCSERFPNDFRVTYIDTRGGIWPYSGLRNADGVVAFETSRITKFHYSTRWGRQHVYTDDCALR